MEFVPPKKMANRMKIGLVGCGALGSFYGAKLFRDGQDVHFLLRSDYDPVRRNGIFITGPEGNFHINPACARSPQEIGRCDLVIVGLKTTANDQYADLLPPLVGPNTAVLTLQNGLGNEEQLAALFGSEKILGGLCFVCLNRVAPGRIQHLAHGRVTLGEFQRWPEPRTHDIASMFRHAGVPCQVTDNLEKAHWEKLVWNIPFNGLGVAGAAGYDALVSGELEQKKLAPCLSTDLLLGDPRWEHVVRELMREIIAAANARGLAVPPETEQTQIERTNEMGAYQPSTLIDFARGHALELQSLFLEPLRLAHAAGIEAPWLTRLCRVLELLDARRAQILG
jgi:2-dehydropantoate 2-reductase